MKVFAHSGDLGDLIAALPVMRTLGGGKLFITETPNVPEGQGPRESMRGNRFKFLAPLLESQPYISSVQWVNKPKGVTHDFTRFRKIYRQTLHLSLTHWQAVFLGVPIRQFDLSPWLTAAPSPLSRGRVVAARSERYHNGMAGAIWNQVRMRYEDRLLFVGLPAEHEEFEKLMGFKVEHAPVKTALDLASIIAGAELFIGNQSLAFWIAAGLGVPFIQESWPRSLNSVVERENGQFTRSAQEIRGLRWPLLSHPVQGNGSSRESERVNQRQLPRDVAKVNQDPRRRGSSVYRTASKTPYAFPKR